MAERVVEETRTEPKDTVVIHEDRGRRSNTPLVLVIILLIIILLILWGVSSLFGGGGDGSTDINVQPQTPTTGQ